MPVVCQISSNESRTLAAKAGLEVGQSLKGDDVVRTLNCIKLNRGVPKVLFCDNGSEFTSQIALAAIWLEHRPVED